MSCLGGWILCRFLKFSFTSRPSYVVPSLVPPPSSPGCVVFVSSPTNGCGRPLLDDNTRWGAERTLGQPPSQAFVRPPAGQNRRHPKRRRAISRGGKKSQRKYRCLAKWRTNPNNSRVNLHFKRETNAQRARSVPTKPFNQATTVDRCI